MDPPQNGAIGYAPWPHKKNTMEESGAQDEAYWTTSHFANHACHSLPPTCCFCLTRKETGYAWRALLVLPVRPGLATAPPLCRQPFAPQRERPGKAGQGGGKGGGWARGVGGVGKVGKGKGGGQGEGGWARGRGVGKGDGSNMKSRLSVDPCTKVQFWYMLSRHRRISTHLLAGLNQILNPPKRTLACKRSCFSQRVF